MADANGLVEAMKRAARDERESSKPVNVYFGAVSYKHLTLPTILRV